MGCYQVSSNLVVNYLQPIKQNVESLNLNYCYWLAPGCCDTIVRCTNLVSLHLLHINISVKRLVGLLAALKKLQRVSVTIKNVKEFQTLLDKTPRAQETMRGVRVLTIQVKNQPVQAQMMTMHFLAVTSFFEYCPSLEEFHVQGLFCTKGIPPYVVNPQVSIEHPWFGCPVMIFFFFFLQFSTGVTWVSLKLNPWTSSKSGFQRRWSFVRGLFKINGEVSENWAYKTSVYSTHQPEKCWCTILSVTLLTLKVTTLLRIRGSSCVEFAATEYLPHHAFVFSEGST